MDNDDSIHREGEKTDKDKKKREQTSMYTQIIDSCRMDEDSRRDMQLLISIQPSQARMNEKKKMNEFEGQTNFLARQLFFEMTFSFSSYIYKCEVIGGVYFYFSTYQISHFSNKCSILSRIRT